MSAYFNDVLLSCVLGHALSLEFSLKRNYPAGSCHEDSRSAAFIGLTSILAGHTFLLEFISELRTVSVPNIFISSVLGILFLSINTPDCFRLRFNLNILTVNDHLQVT